MVTYTSGGLRVDLASSADIETASTSIALEPHTVDRDGWPAAVVGVQSGVEGGESALLARAPGFTGDAVTSKEYMTGFFEPVIFFSQADPSVDIRGVLQGTHVRAEIGEFDELRAGNMLLNAHSSTYTFLHGDEDIREIAAKLDYFMHAMNTGRQFHVPPTPIQSIPFTLTHSLSTLTTEVLSVPTREALPYDPPLLIVHGIGESDALTFNTHRLGLGPHRDRDDDIDFQIQVRDLLTPDAAPVQLTMATTTLNKTSAVEANILDTDAVIRYSGFEDDGITVQTELLQPDTDTWSSRSSVIRGRLLHRYLDPNDNVLEDASPWSPEFIFRTPASIPVVHPNAGMLTFDGDGVVAHTVWGLSWYQITDTATAYISAAATVMNGVTDLVSTNGTLTVSLGEFSASDAELPEAHLPVLEANQPVETKAHVDFPSPDYPLGNIKLTLEYIGRNPANVTGVPVHLHPWALLSTEEPKDNYGYPQTTDTGVIYHVSGGAGALPHRVYPSEPHLTPHLAPEAGHPYDFHGAMDTLTDWRASRDAVWLPGGFDTPTVPFAGNNDYTIVTTDELLAGGVRYICLKASPHGGKRFHTVRFHVPSTDTPLAELFQTIQVATPTTGWMNGFGSSTNDSDVSDNAGCLLINASDEHTLVFDMKWNGLGSVMIRLGLPVQQTLASDTDIPYWHVFTPRVPHPQIILQ